MKPIVIRRFCRPSFPILVLFLLSIAIPLWLLFAGLIVVGALLPSFVLLGLGIFLCYGIKITEKYVDNIAAALSACKKVHIINRYKSEK